MHSMKLLIEITLIMLVFIPYLWVKPLLLMLQHLQII